MFNCDNGFNSFRHVTQLSTNQIASATSKDITKLKQIIPKSDKQRQLQVEKLEGNFKEAINSYYQLQKVRQHEIVSLYIFIFHIAIFFSLGIASVTF